MRERENKRKANLKKRVEREEREREARARMNIPSPVKGFYVGPSQIRLSGFLDTGVKRKREEREAESENKEKKESEPVKSKGEELEIMARKTAEPVMATIGKPKSQKTGCMKPSLQQLTPPQSRAPLQPRSANPIIRPKPLFFAEPAKSSMAIENDWDSFLASNTQIEQELAGPETVTNVAAAPPPPARPFLIPVNDTTDILGMISTQDLDYTDENAPVEPSIPFREPKSEYCSKEEVDTGGETERRHTAAKFRKEVSHEGSGKPESDYGDDIEYEPDRKDEDIDSIHLSNHQASKKHCLDEQPDFAKDLSDADDPNHTLAVQSNPQNPDSDFDDGLQDAEFEAIILDYETRPRPTSFSLNTHTPPFPEPRHTPVLESFDYGDFELSTQEMLELEP